MENLSSQIIDQGPGVAPCPCGVDDDLALTQTTSPNLPEPGSKSVPDSRYCFSYTPFLLTLWPFASVPLMVTVRLLPSPDTTIRPLVISLPPFMTLNPNIRSSILVYDRASDSGSPLTGYSLPSNLPVHW